MQRRGFVIPIPYRQSTPVPYRLHTAARYVSSYRFHTDVIPISYWFHTGLIRYEAAPHTDNILIQSVWTQLHTEDILIQSVWRQLHTDFTGMKAVFIPISYWFHTDLISYRGFCRFMRFHTYFIPMYFHTDLIGMTYRFNRYEDHSSYSFNTGCLL